MPVYGSHHWEEFFPTPEKFIPERFLKTNQSQIKPFTFRPFGGGNRACIGQRFAINEMKICMSMLLSKYRLEKVPQTKLDLVNGSLGMLVFNDITVKLVPREA
jgi:cytochrome P450